MVDSIPSRNPSNEDSLAGVFKEILRKYGQSFDDMLPAIVEVHDRATNRVKVRPLVSMVTTDKTVLSRAAIPSIPVLRPGGGGFFISFPLNAGDLGWLKANDRDISLFLQSFKESKPNTKRLHSFEDAVFIPDIVRAYTIAAEDANALVIQSTDGATKISIKDGEITIKAGTITGEGDMTLDGNLTVTGNVVGETGVSAGTGPLTVGLLTHTHISNGPSNPTNAPTPGT